MKILLAIDDSKFSDAAVQAVIAEHQPQTTQVKVLNVVDLALPIPTSVAEGFRSEGLRHGKQVVWHTELLLKQAGYSVETAVEEGDPESKILAAAREWNADLIVLGSHGRKGLEHFLEGSVSEAVSRRAGCSVEVVRVHP